MNQAEALGQRLRAAREARELTLDEAERATRIRAKFLEALERGDHTSMTPVQAQGFLRNYARFLGLDYDLLLSELEPPGRGRRRRKQPLAAAAPPPTAGPRPAVRRVTPVETPRTAPGPQPNVRRPRGWLATMAIVLFAGALVVVLVVSLTRWFDRLATSPDNDQPTGGLIETPPVAPATEVAEDAPPPDAEQPPTPQTGYTPPAITGTGVTVTIRLTQPTWLRVTVDGEVAQEGQGNPGEVWQFVGERSVGVRASNAAALDLTVNNQPQGVLGERGELFDQTFSLSGAATPTLAPTNTASITPSPTLTLTGTASRTPTFTATASSTASSEQATLLFSPTPTFERLVGSLTPTPSLTMTPSVTLTATATLTATFTPTLTPSPVSSPTNTLTPSPSPFLPPRLTRTPSPVPKP